jgi:hypothetical protein
MAEYFMFFLNSKVKTLVFRLFFSTGSCKVIMYYCSIKNTKI